MRGDRSSDGASGRRGVPAPVQYSPETATTAVYLQNGHFLPEDRLTEIFRGHALGQGVRSDVGRHDAPSGGALAGVQRARAGSHRERGQREASGRDGVPDRRADALAARDRHAVAGVLPSDRAAGQPVGGPAGLLGA